MNYYDSYIKNSFNKKEELIIMNNDSEYFAILENRYPILGSKIQWSKTINNFHKKANPLNLEKDYLSFFQLISFQLVSNTKNMDIVYVGDGLTDFAYTFKYENLELFIKIITEIPQHHYFMPPSGDWCISFTMERYLEFGESIWR